ncbi:MAG: YHS domain-containing (seleno)protein [Chthoniobacterales bacterium]
MKILAGILPLVCLAALSFSARAEPGPNIAKDGLALQGYDPVAFFTDGKPVLGKEEFHGSYHDATYRFASAEHQALFEKNPAKYEPQFGGYCAYGVSKGHLSPVKIDAFQIVNGRLLMQYDSEVKNAFNKDQHGNLDTADKNWPTLSAKGG